MFDNRTGRYERQERTKVVSARLTATEHAAFVAACEAKGAVGAPNRTRYWGTSDHVRQALMQYAETEPAALKRG